MALHAPRSRDLRLTVALSLLLAWLLSTLGAGPTWAAPAVAPASAPAGAAWWWPLEPIPRVLGGFRPPAQRWLAGHRGVDLAAEPGQTVRAAGAGTVTFAGHVVDRGVVVVAHGDLRTTYEPVHVSVTRGDTVTRGAVLGSVSAGSAHCPGTTCLHWGLRRGQDYLDPLLLVRPGAVRLLPRWALGPRWSGFGTPVGAPRAGPARFSSALLGPAQFSSAR